MRFAIIILSTLIVAVSSAPIAVPRDGPSEQSVDSPTWATLMTLYSKRSLAQESNGHNTICSTVVTGVERRAHSKNQGDPAGSSPSLRSNHNQIFLISRSPT
ncbi:hypothetical protein CYLTODRAFT_82634 [Cylindrobasidium torrendii FP15055 ss-10]|uniref:Uncharacterized protein n=1 Tax=Cylindrobasidium torrendii FP15055 ss-10 TaxID=1314674 RepID=A0A0D7B306_9AGAR|nr:hypothetical protein CYLTODRAFT_82634 [Cylindrobasidium torrendii FP15055 ss-10]